MLLHRSPHSVITNHYGVIVLRARPHLRAQRTTTREGFQKGDLDAAFVGSAVELCAALARDALEDRRWLVRDPAAPDPTSACSCHRAPTTPDATFEALARRNDTAVGYCKVCRLGWAFDGGGLTPFASSVGFDDEEIAGVVAAIRAGAEVVVGGSRTHTTYRVNRDGELVSAQFDEGAEDETPIDETALRYAIAGSPDAFLGALRGAAIERLREALLAARSFPDAAVTDALDRVLAYGEHLSRPDMLAAVVCDDPLPEMTGVTGNDVYHVVASALGYAMSPAAGALGVRFFSLLEAKLGDVVLPEFGHYRDELRKTAGDDLLAAIAAAPDDDAPRLVFADTLTEQGDPRGEFIVAQCTLAKLDPDAPERAVLDPRCQELVKTHGESWSGLLRGRFRRGFLDSVDVRWSQFSPYGGIAFRIVPPVREIRLTHERDDFLADVEPVLADPRWANVPALDLSKPYFEQRDPDSDSDGAIKTPFGPRIVPQLEALSGLRELKMRYADLTPEHLAVIGRCARLQRLDLGDNSFARGSLAALLVGALGELRALSLTSCWLQNDDLGALGRGLAKLGKLEELDLAVNGLSDIVTTIVVNQAPRLRRLELRGNFLGDDSVLVLARMKELASLVLTACNIGNRGVAGLSQLPLTSLDLRENHFDEKGLRSLLAGPLASSLRRLRIGAGRGLGQRVVRELKGLPNLWELDVRGTSVNADGAIELLEAIPTLRWLRLGQCSIDDAGLAKLAAHPRFAQLTLLELDRNPLTAEGRARAATAPQISLEMVL